MFWIVWPFFMFLFLIAVVAVANISYVRIPPSFFLSLWKMDASTHSGPLTKILTLFSIFLWPILYPNILLLLLLCMWHHLWTLYCPISNWSLRQQHIRNIEKLNNTKDDKAVLLILYVLLPMANPKLITTMPTYQQEKVAIDRFESVRPWRWLLKHISKYVVCMQAKMDVLAHWESRILEEVFTA